VPFRLRQTIFTIAISGNPDFKVFLRQHTISRSPHRRLLTPLSGRRRLLPRCVAASHLKEVLRFAAIINRINDTSRDKNPKAKYCMEPIGYREIVRLLNADPAQKKKLPVVHSDNSVTGFHRDYPLQVDCPSYTEIRDAKHLKDVMGDLDVGRLHRVSLRAAEAALGCASTSYNRSHSRYQGPPQKRRRF
jgi:hypothetical protein